MCRVRMCSCVCRCIHIRIMWRTEVGFGMSATVTLPCLWDRVSSVNPNSQWLDSVGSGSSEPSVCLQSKGWRHTLLWFAFDTAAKDLNSEIHAYKTSRTYRVCLQHLQRSFCSKLYWGVMGKGRCIYLRCAMYSLYVCVCVCVFMCMCNDYGNN